MPFVKWTIEPVFLSRQPIPPDKNVTDELEACANSSLVGTLRQLACLVSVADCIFEGIAAECKVVYERSVRLKDKLERCEKSVSQLNAKAVQIRECCLFLISKTRHPITRRAGSAAVGYAARFYREWALCSIPVVFAERLIFSNLCSYFSPSLNI